MRWAGNLLIVLGALLGIPATLLFIPGFGEHVLGLAPFSDEARGAGIVALVLLGAGTLCKARGRSLKGPAKRSDDGGAESQAV